MKRSKKNKSKVIDIISHPSLDELLNNYPILLYVDGGVITRNPSKIGGTWAWCQVQRNIIIKGLSGIITPTQAELPLVTNNLTELIAAVEGMESLPDGWAETIFTDSDVTRRRIKIGSISAMYGVPIWLLDRLKKERNRLGIYHVELIKGHPCKKDLEFGKTKDGKPVSKHNVWCDKRCKIEATKYLLEHKKESQ